MRKCRFCAKEIDDAAAACPHCGQDFFPGRKAAVVTVTAVPAPAPFIRPAEFSAVAVDGPVLRVSVVDINMPMASMVGFMVKWAIAAIPAFLILFGLAAAVGVFFGVLFGRG